MAKYNGDLFLIKLGNEDGPPETFTTIACMRSTSLSLNNEQIDVTSKCDTPWRELIEGGIRSMSLSLSGIFNDDATIDSINDIALAGTIKNYEIVSERGDSYTGAFQISSFERSGEYNDAEQYSVSLESSGTITHTDA